MPLMGRMGRPGCRYGGAAAGGRSVVVRPPRCSIAATTIVTTKPTATGVNELLPLDASAGPRSGDDD